MAKCGYCRSVIIAGGVRDGEQRFCNDRCCQSGMLVAVSNQLDPSDVRSAVTKVHQGACPRCGGSGPVDVTTSYKIWSAVLLTSWSSSPEISCRSCGRKRQIKALLFSAVAGWWGIPWGLIITPVQIARNIRGLFLAYDPYQPSAQLESAVRVMLASELARQAASTGDA
jgi:DNA-directed RNA polymerase subunit RPC12/RpoP